MSQMQEQGIAERAIVDNSDDQASQALVDALQICFKILKWIMVFVVVMFLFSGAFTVKPEEVALVMRFGKVVGTGPERELKPGFHVAWPEPIDRVIKIPKETLRSVDCEFWYYLTEQEKLQGKSGRVGASLVPGKDHAVITADANLLHVNMNIKYRIVDAYDYVKNIYGAEHPENIPEKSLIKCLADEAIIYSAANFKVDDLIGPKKTSFARMVKDYLDRELLSMECGLKLDEVLIPKIEPPRQVVKYFIDVRNAAEEKHAKIQEAIGDETELLTKTAGTGYQELIKALILEQKYEKTNDPKLPEARKRVRELLAQAGGTVQDILADAKIYKTKVVESARADAEYLQALLPRYQESPNVVLTRLLLSTLEKLLPKVRKWYLPEHVDQARFIIDRDPQELKQQLNEQESQNNKR